MLLGGRNTYAASYFPNLCRRMNGNAEPATPAACGELPLGLVLPDRADADIRM